MDVPACIGIRYFPCDVQTDFGKCNDELSLHGRTLKQRKQTMSLHSRLAFPEFRTCMATITVGSPTTGNSHFVSS